MPGSRKQLLVALAAILGGTVAFIVFLGLTGVDGDKVPLGLLDWVAAGILIGPGFGLLIKWRHTRANARGKP